MGKTSIPDSALDGIAPAADSPVKVRDPHDISTWGRACATGVPYKNTGVTTDGAKNQRRTLSGGRKHRGLASDDLEKRERESK